MLSILQLWSGACYGKIKLVADSKRGFLYHAFRLRTKTWVIRTCSKVRAYVPAPLPSYWLKQRCTAGIN